MNGPTELLRQKAIKVTAQRVAIMEFLHGNKDHPSVDEVYRKVKKKFSYISRATVYNTVKALAKSGVLQEVLVQQDKSRVDANVSQHHHFKCLKCGKVEDVPYGILTAAQAAQRAKTYHVREVRVVVEGLCRRCR